MKILQLVKFYSPSKGGIENVASSIVSLFKDDDEFQFTIYTNNHIKSKRDIVEYLDFAKVIRKSTPFFMMSQPISLNYFDLFKEIKKNDIIHLHFPFPQMELCLLLFLSLIRKKKVIITYHANPEYTRWKFISFIYKIFYIKLFNKVSNIIFTSENLKIYSNLPKKILAKSTVIPLYFDRKFDYFNGINDIPKNKNQIIAVGKLRKYKGFNILIESMKGVDSNLVIIGSGEEYNNLVRLINDNDLTDKVKIITECDDLSLYKNLLESKFLVLPSINESEAFGIVQLEAMAFGLPVINTYLKSGVPNVSIHDYTGLTVNPKSVSELNIAIKCLLDDEERLKKYSDNALIQSSKFSSFNVKKMYLDLYK